MEIPLAHPQIVKKQKPEASALDFCFEIVYIRIQDQFRKWQQIFVILFPAQDY